VSSWANDLVSSALSAELYWAMNSLMKKPWLSCCRTWAVPMRMRVAFGDGPVSLGPTGFYHGVRVECGQDRVRYKKLGPCLRGEPGTGVDLA